MIKERLGAITEQHEELANAKKILEKDIKEYGILATKLGSTQGKLSNKRDLLEKQKTLIDKEKEYYQTRQDQFASMISDYDKKGESLSNRYKQAGSDYNQKIREYTNYQDDIKRKVKEINRGF